MQTFATDLADLLAAAVPSEMGDNDCEDAIVRLQPWQPCLVLLAESDGRLISSLGNSGEDAAELAVPLAFRCAERLQERHTCRFAHAGTGGSGTVLATRLPSTAGGTIIACVLRSDVANRGRASARTDLGCLTAALVARLASGTVEQAALATRIAHYQAEHDTLRSAHSEAIVAAIEEREERLLVQQEHARQLQRDIAVRQRAEQELKRLHLQNELILNSAGEGICGLDEESRIIFINPAAARMLGYQRKELVEEQFHEKIHHSRADGTPVSSEKCRMCRALDGQLATRVDTEVFWRANGKPFPVEYTIRPIDDGGTTGGAVVTFRDISEQRMLEAQLRQAQKLESIGQLAAGIAHEINTPTQYIGDNTRFLEDAFTDIGTVLEHFTRLLDAVKTGSTGPGLVDEVEHAIAVADLKFVTAEIPQAIRQSLDGVAQVAKIVRSMKEFSHPGGDEKQAVDLNKAIQSTLTVSRNEWKYVADMVTDFDESLPSVTCMPGDFNQVVLNLVVNAAHAIADQLRGTPGEKGTITIRTRHDGEFAEIRVADTGTGIPPAVRDRVFDPFFTTKEVGRGTGQGLAIVHSIITERHGGTIRLETGLGCGTEFIVRLPIEPKELRHATDSVCR